MAKLLLPGETLTYYLVYLIIWINGRCVVASKHYTTRESDPFSAFFLFREQNLPTDGTGLL